MQALYLRRHNGVYAVSHTILIVTFTLMALQCARALPGKTNLNLVRPPHRKTHSSPGGGSTKKMTGSALPPDEGASPESKTRAAKGNAKKLKLRPGSKGKYRADGMVIPGHAVRSEDPDHPGMRTYIDRETAHTMCLMPENTFWKDHDSEGDGGHPNWNVLRIEAMDSSEAVRDIWKKVEEEFDVNRWTDENYNKTIAKYGLQDFEQIRAGVPKLWFEPFDSSELEDDLEDEVHRPAPGEEIPHEGEPFCQRCHCILGIARPSLRLEFDPWDPRCRICGFLNAHGPDGRLLADPEQDVTEVPVSDLLNKAQDDDIERHIAAVNAEDSDDDGDRVEELRLTVEQRCDECGHSTAFYRTAQVRGADEGQTAFFQCVRCKYQWAVKG